MVRAVSRQSEKMWKEHEQGSRGPKSLYLATPLVFNSSDGGVPWDGLRKIFCEWVAKLPNGQETLLKFSTG